MYYVSRFVFFFLFKQKTAYDMRISDWSSDVCSSDLVSVVDIATAGALGGDAQLDRTQRATRRTAERIGGSTRFTLAFGRKEDGIPVVVHTRLHIVLEIGRASCRERVCTYV